MKKQVMKTAWEIAKEAALKFGKKVREYFREALKMAWAMIKRGDKMEITTKNGNMKITIKDRKADIYTPYNPDFIKQVKTLGAKWNPHDKCWSVNEEDVKAVREMMLNVYGETDIKTPTLTVKIKIKEKLENRDLDQSEIKFLGKTLCYDGTKVGKDVTYISGKAQCTYAVGYVAWIEKGTVIELKNVSEALYNRYVNETTNSVLKNKIEILSIELDKQKETNEPKELNATREQEKFATYPQIRKPKSLPKYDPYRQYKKNVIEQADKCLVAINERIRKFMDLNKMSEKQAIEIVELIELYFDFDDNYRFMGDCYYGNNLGDVIKMMLIEGKKIKKGEM